MRGPRVALYFRDTVTSTVGLRPQTSFGGGVTVNPSKCGLCEVFVRA